MEKPDILVFMSDQHNAAYSGFAGNVTVRTPNLDKLAESGTVLDAAYTSCPLCVPSRMSMLSGQLPSKTGIFTNEGALPCDQATFMHSLAAEGYETVLCGRMHFKGDDQRHGFTKRIMGDITPLYWGRSGKDRTDLGCYTGTLNGSKTFEAMGGGNSPVLEYDRAVIQAALDYLSEPKDKPQCIFVGIYAPHYTYVAPPELYSYYKDRVEQPKTWVNQPDYNCPAVEHRKRQMTVGTVLQARAAYFGMIENMDRQVGQVKEAWDVYLEKSGRKGVFAYVSDHGDQAGERCLFDKHTFFDGSARIPAIFQGEGIARGKRVQGAASIMDVGPTLCEMVGALVPPFQDGRSLVKYLATDEDDMTRAVISEFVEKGPEGLIAGRMVRKGKWKLITYDTLDSDLLFDMKSDPDELHNAAGEQREMLDSLKKIAKADWDANKIVVSYQNRIKHVDILKKWGRIAAVEEAERWRAPASALVLPEIV